MVADFKEGIDESKSFITKPQSILKNNDHHSSPQ